MKRIFIVLALGALVVTAASPAQAGVMTTYVDPGPAYNQPVVVYQQAPPPVVYYQPQPQPPPVVYYQPQAPPPPPPVMANPLVPVMMLGLGALAVAAIAANDHRRHRVPHYHWRPPYRPVRPWRPYPWRHPGWHHR